MRYSNILNFNGNAEIAFAFYKKVLGGENPIGPITYKDVDHFSKLYPTSRNKLIFTELRFKDFILRGTDVPALSADEAVKTWISIDFQSFAEAQPIIEEFTKMGEVILPLSEVLEDVHVTKIRDQFGIGWYFIIDQSKTFRA